MFIFTEIRYLILRKRGQTVLLTLIALLLSLALTFYLGNIRSSEITLENLGETLPVHAKIVSMDGTQETGLTIPDELFDALISADVREPVYTASAFAVMNAENQAMGAEKIDTSITGANSIDVLSNIREDTVTLAQGRDLSFFGGEEAVCILLDSFADDFDVKIGDTVTLPIYLIRDGYWLEEMGEASLEVVGTFGLSSATDSASTQMVVPVEWLRSAAKKSGAPFSYGSLRVTLNDPRNLYTFKREMRRAHFQIANRMFAGVMEGQALSVEDKLYLKTSDKLRENISLFKAFLIPFGALVLLMQMFFTYLVLKNARPMLAVANSMGRTKFQCGLTYFVGVLLLDIVGCAIAIPILLLATSLSAGVIFTVLGIFLLTSVVGTIGALVFLLRFDTLALLTRVD